MTKTTIGDLLIYFALIQTILVALHHYDIINVHIALIPSYLLGLLLLALFIGYKWLKKFLNK